MDTQDGHELGETGSVPFLMVFGNIHFLLFTPPQRPFKRNSMVHAGSQHGHLLLWLEFLLVGLATDLVKNILSKRPRENILKKNGNGQLMLFMTWC